MIEKKSRAATIRKEGEEQGMKETGNEGVQKSGKRKAVTTHDDEKAEMKKNNWRLERKRMKLKRS